MKIYVFLADGFETVEALGIVDVLRRGGVDVSTVSVMGRNEVITGQQVKVIADELYENANFSDGDAFFVPGGVGGVDILSAHEGVHETIMKAFADGKYICAICAGPSVIGRYGILNGKKATCYPGYEKYLDGAEYTGDGVTVDGKVITGRGMGKTTDMALALLEIFTDKSNSDKIGNAIQYLN